MTVPHLVSLRNDHWKSGVLAITGSFILACPFSANQTLPLL